MGRGKTTPIAYKYGSLPSSLSKPSPPPSPKFQFSKLLPSRQEFAAGLGLGPSSTQVIGGPGIGMDVGEGDEKRQVHRTDPAALRGTMFDPERRGDRFGDTAAAGGIGAPTVTWGPGYDEASPDGKPVDRLGRGTERMVDMLKGMLGGGVSGERQSSERSDDIEKKRVALSPIDRQRMQQQVYTPPEPSEGSSLDGADLQERIRQLLRRGSEHYRADYQASNSISPVTPRRNSFKVKDLMAHMQRRESGAESMTQSRSSEPSPTTPMNPLPNPMESRPVMIPSTVNLRAKTRSDGPRKGAPAQMPRRVEFEADSITEDAESRKELKEPDYYKEIFFSAPERPSRPVSLKADYEAVLEEENRRHALKLKELKAKQNTEEKVKNRVAIPVEAETAPTKAKTTKSDDRPVVAPPSQSSAKLQSVPEKPRIKASPQLPPGTPLAKQNSDDLYLPPVPTTAPFKRQPTGEIHDDIQSANWMAPAKLDGGSEISPAFQDALHSAKGSLNSAMLQYFRSTGKTKNYSDTSEMLLKEQVDWMEANAGLIDGEPLQSLETLANMYRKGEVLVNDPSFTRSSSKPKKLQKLLEGGAPYLTLLALFEATVYSAEMISASLADQLEEIQNGLKQIRATPSDFTTAMEGIKQAIQGVPKEQLVDAQAKQAYKQIIALRELKKGQIMKLSEAKRTETSVKDTASQKLKSILKPKKEDAPPTRTEPKLLTKEGPAPAVEASTRSARPSQSVSSSSKTIKKESAGPPEDGNPPRKAGVKDSYIAFKDGGPSLPIPSEEPEEEPKLYNYNGQVVTQSAMSLLEKEDKLAKKGLFERDGVIMTSSALSLLQAQEAMDRADTSGQGEWGPDIWDPIRGAYIPAWAKPLGQADVFPLVDNEGHRLRDEKGDLQEDWYDTNIEAIEAKNLLQFGMEGVVDHPY